MSDEKRILWTPTRKQEILLRLLKGESPQEIARELGLGMSMLYSWRDRFLEAGMEGLKYGGKSKALHDSEEELRQARQTIGKLTMELELHEKKFVWRKPGRNHWSILRLPVPGHDDL
jgi:transposase